MNKTLIAAALALAGVAGTADAAKLNLVNIDVPGVGLNDTAPLNPVGGNPGRTLGEQRQLVYRYALNLWGNVLGGNVQVDIQASFAPLACTPTSGTLGSAGAMYVVPRGDLPNWMLYPGALGNVLSGVDNDPAMAEINTRFNGALGTPTCLTGSGWYYGLDGRTPVGKINFLNVVMHEIGHGLGVAGFLNKTTGALFAGYPDIYTSKAFDNVLGKSFTDPTMTNALRAEAMRTPGRTVWSGANVNQQAALLLDRGYTETRLSITAPAGIAREYAIGTAAFGPAPTAANFSGTFVLAQDAADAAGPLTTDGCSPLTNAAAIAGKVAIIDRGTCGFSVKVANAQAAGARAVVIANSAAGAMGNMGGTDATITIPSVMVAFGDGTAIKGNLPATGSAGPGVPTLAGTDAAGRARLYSPWTVATGSTFSHFDTVANPNALMEPFDTPSVQAHNFVDMTAALFQDIGWPMNRANARINACDTGIPAATTAGLLPGARVVADIDMCRVASGGVRSTYLSCAKASLYRAQAEYRINAVQFGKAYTCVLTNP